MTRYKARCYARLTEDIVNRETLVTEHRLRLYIERWILSRSHRIEIRKVSE
jgi:hypothetical protein